MGPLVSKNAKNQVLILGPEGSGKTTLLYTKKIRTLPMKATPTNGFQYEEIPFSDGDNTQIPVGFWDIGGNDASQMVITALT